MAAIVYIHIGKTGGTALRKSLQNAGLSCSYEFAQSRMTKDEARELDKFDIVCGHISRADQLRWFPNCKVIVTLRHPIERCFSWVRYVRSIELTPTAPPICHAATNLNDLQLVNTIEGQRNTNNTAVRQLGAHMMDLLPDFDIAPLIDRAKTTLREAMWVGHAESSDADILQLGRLLGVSLKNERHNVTPERQLIEKEDLLLYSRLAATNQHDLKLWHWSKSTIPAVLDCAHRDDTDTTSPNDRLRSERQEWTL